MDAARGCVGVAAMLVFFASVLIGWLMMVFMPVLSGGQPLANLGILTFWSVASLIVWRIAGGKGWGFASAPASGAGVVSSSTSSSNPLGGPEEVPADWMAAIAQRGLSRVEIAQTLDAVYGRANSAGFVRPDRRDVFRALQLTPLDKVRVVILGQDPYPTPGEADGLAFSVPRGYPIPHSLSRIFSNLESDRELGFRPPPAGNLSAWAERGVLLLNTALTFEDGGPIHRSRWEPFTRRVLAAVNESPHPTVFMLWGDEANSLANEVPLNPAQHLLLRSTHPRQETATRYPRFADTRHFSEANEFLRARGRGTIDWTL